MKVVTFKADEDLIEQLDRFAINNGIYRSEAIRIAIERMLQEEMKEKGARIIKISLR